ncbi:MAG TPA: hypothetical protein VGI95_21095 [Caulobacteraceae bacterium]|jgi:hypothetical protein
MKPGDQVLLDGMVATVLCDVDAGEYSPDYPAAEWAAVLTTGLLVMTAETGLTYCPDASKTMPISS